MYSNITSMCGCQMHVQRQAQDEIEDSDSALG